MTPTLARDAIEERPLRLRYVLMPFAEVALSRRLGRAELRRLRLAKLRLLGIMPLSGEKPVDAWVRVMAAENGFPDLRPLPQALGDEIYWDRDALEFFNWLA